MTDIAPCHSLTRRRARAVAPPFSEEAGKRIFLTGANGWIVALAERGVHASVVRPARSVHGLGERHGFVPTPAAIARRTGMSAYVGDGLNRWPAVHVRDAARVYCLALERGAASEAFHAVAEGVPFRALAEAIGRQVGVPVTSIAPERSEAHVGSLATWLAGGAAVSRRKTRAVLGWEPMAVGLLADVDRPDHFGS